MTFSSPKSKVTQERRGHVYVSKPIGDGYLDRRARRAEIRAELARARKAGLIKRHAVKLARIQGLAS